MRGLRLVTITAASVALMAAIATPLTAGDGSEGQQLAEAALLDSTDVPAQFRNSYDFYPFDEVPVPAGSACRTVRQAEARARELPSATIAHGGNGAVIHAAVIVFPNAEDAGRFVSVYEGEKSCVKRRIKEHSEQYPEGTLLGVKLEEADLDAGDRLVGYSGFTTIQDEGRYKVENHYVVVQDRRVVAKLYLEGEVSDQPEVANLPRLSVIVDRAVERASKAQDSERRPLGAVAETKRGVDLSRAGAAAK